MSFPPEWTRMMEHLWKARTEAVVLGTPGMPQEARDTAMRRYVEAVDVVIDALGRLEDDRVLERLTMYLLRQDLP